ncbi:MAG: hypothetical protein IH611_02825, partial [Deltaproteobacteria bacterium]|nr:hypothetical protein [Deltaproteobacteria bacterium]
AIRSRDKTANKMTAGQIAQAQKLAREWKPRNGGETAASGTGRPAGTPPLLRRGK